MSNNDAPGTLATLEWAAQGITDIPLHALCSNDANGWVQFSFNILPQLMPYFGKPVQIGFNMRDLPPQRKESRH